MAVQPLHGQKVLPGGHRPLVVKAQTSQPSALPQTSQLPPPGQEVQVVPGAPGVQAVPRPPDGLPAQRVPGQLPPGQRVQVLPGGVAGGGLREGTRTSSGSCGRVHATVGGGRDAAVAQRGGSVPVELTGDPVLAGQTLEGRRTAEAVLQDAWKRVTELS